MNTLILGAGLAGISASYHLGHENCRLLEKELRGYGLIQSGGREGFLWDRGPHVSFTKHDYVKDLFAQSVGANGFEEYEVVTGNYFRGGWVTHPAQCHLYQVPEPLRTECLNSFLERRNAPVRESATEDYGAWLIEAFGDKFASTFPAAYTRKYWTREPRELTTAWVGKRVFYPKVEDVVEGSRGPLNRRTHYITKVRYPKKGGYESFAHLLGRGARIEFGAEVVRIDLTNRAVYTAAGGRHDYEHLVNTLPLPVFVSLCAEATDEVREAVRALSCTQLCLVNVAAPHPARRPENWIYVYDEDMLATRINFTEKLSAGNAPAGWTGVQVEVYFSRHRPLGHSVAEVERRVVEELVKMGLVDRSAKDAGRLIVHSTHVPWANVIFDHDTAPALDIVWRWLERHGGKREPDDVHPLTDWASAPRLAPAGVRMAGRFGQWKYFWTDDSVLRGRQIATGQPLLNT